MSFEAPFKYWSESDWAQAFSVIEQRLKDYMQQLALYIDFPDENSLVDDFMENFSPSDIFLMYDAKNKYLEAERTHYETDDAEDIPTLLARADVEEDDDDDDYEEPEEDSFVRYVLNPYASYYKTLKSLSAEWNRAYALSTEHSTRLRAQFIVTSYAELLEKIDFILNDYFPKCPQFITVAFRLLNQKIEALCQVLASFHTHDSVYCEILKTHCVQLTRLSVEIQKNILR